MVETRSKKYKEKGKEDNQREILNILSQLKEESSAIIVEGQKDIRALKFFEIKNVFSLSKKAIFEIIEDISKQYESIIILTDFDKKGKELYDKILKEASRLKLKVDNKYRKFFQTNTQLSHIEGLKTYITNYNNKK